ncbi:hypothetical protein BDV95DRAFT_606164 [Massariosphaeria phaeospora]|uniref:SWIM-type domain-containing protein n=1 Tax=Massariosphaeria phaeospora TaxID=100035 RepID=A0A7C8MQI9_9PLEO|nr:hypothetical protein BDV95DRAFT_606164 [Massariosphaeria phaeospora]
MPRAKKAAAIVISSDAEEAVEVQPKRSSRKRKQVNYAEPALEDEDWKEAPKQKVKQQTQTQTQTRAAEAAPLAVEDPPPRARPTKKRRKALDSEIEYDEDGQEIRKREWVDEPSVKFLGNKDRALSHPIRFLERIRCDTEVPQEKFVIMGTEGHNYTVDITLVSRCACMDWRMRRIPCKHIIYTLINVLGLSEDSELLYQPAYTSSELRGIFDQAPPDPRTNVEIVQDPKRRPIEGECPICYTSFEPGAEAIVYCKGDIGCGNNIHGACMASWLRAQRGSYHKGTCPLCRKDWVD